LVGPAFDGPGAGRIITFNGVIAREAKHLLEFRGAAFGALQLAQVGFRAHEGIEVSATMITFKFTHWSHG
jgi:hypothetical protein